MLAYFLYLAGGLVAFGLIGLSVAAAGRL